MYEIIPPITIEGQEAFVLNNYKVLPQKRMAAMLGRSDSFVKRVLKNNGIKVSREIIEKFHKQSQFKPGQVPFSKGKSKEEYMTKEQVERSKKNCFKKGHLPHNTKKDGDISIRHNKRRDRKSKWIRIEKRKWVSLARYTWEQEKGPIPKGHNVQYKDGDSLNCDIDNLYLISRKHQATINYHFGGKALPGDLVPTAILLTKLNKKIKSHDKK